MEYTTLISSKDEQGVGVIQLNRPDVHNAFDDVLIRELTESLGEFERDDSIRAVLLKSSGKSFSAGADLNWMKRMAEYGWTENYQDSLALATLMQTLANMSKPTIGVIQGAAFGGGVGLVACCDIALASTSAIFCLSEVRLGLIPAVISPYVIAAIGARAARRYFVTAERFDAQVALRLGLVHELFAAENLDDAAAQMAKAIANNGPKAVVEAMRLIDKVSIAPIDEDMVRYTASKIADLRATAEGREGVAAFLEKREPNWDVKNTPDLGD